MDAEMETLKIIDISQQEQWNLTVKKFSNWDIYYLWEYAYSLFLHGDGTPKLIYFQKEQASVCYVVMENDIAKEPFFSGYLNEGEYLDWTTPYGYGGPLVEGQLWDSFASQLIEELTRYAADNHIVTQFLRFHPLLGNQKNFEDVMDVVYLKKTIYMDTSDEDTIFLNMTSKNRNMVRKAIKNDIKIVTDHGERLKEFQRVYEATMERHQAESYYYFEESYYQFLMTHMKKNTVFFYAEFQGQVVSASIFFYNDRYMHYHLSGTLPQHRNLAAANLLLDEAAKWAAGRGIKCLHLGGGVANEDSLYAFKKQFNRNGELDFCIGRSIFMPDAYQQLVALRRDNDKTFDDQRPFLIKYRG